MSLTSPLSTPACTAAPIATTSSGLTPLCGSLPPVSFLTSSWIIGMRVEPPTSTTWSIAETSLPQSLTARSNGTRQRSTRSSVRRSNSARESFCSRCSGPSAVAVTNGRLIVVSATWLSSIFAFSAASFSRCSAILSPRQVDAVLVLERLHEPVDDPLVPVVAAELRVAVGGLDLEHAVADLQQRHVERAAAEVEDEDGVIGLTLVEPVGERGRGRLVDDPQHLEARDLAGLLGGLALRVVEVRGHGDHGLRDGVAEVRLGVALELEQDLGADLLRGPLLAVDVDGPSPCRPCAA